MRVLHVLDHSIPLQSGYTHRTRAILREQRRLGWETSHLTSEKHPSEVLEEEVEGLVFHRTLPTGGLSGSLPVVRQLAVIRSLERRLSDVAKRVKPDVLHAHSPALNGVAALRVGRALGIPVVYELRAFWEDAAVDHGTSGEGGLRYRLSRGLESRVLKRADWVTTICEGIRADIVARGVPASKVTVIPNAVDVEGFTVERNRDEALARELGLNGAPVVGFVGSFYGYEGLALLLEALALLRDRGKKVQALLVGGGYEEERLRERARALGLGGQAIFTGRVPFERVRAYYDLIDLLVYPRLPMRLTETVTPLKPLEAMAMGKRLLASNVGGHRELVRDGETGFLFEAGDRTDLARKLEGLLSQDADEALRQRARRFVEGERTWARSVARYRPVYEALARA